jgi:DNA-directed RNA polymerase subunit RPC12/RpoP
MKKSKEAKRRSMARMNEFLKKLIDLVTLTVRCPDCGGECEQLISPTSSEPNIYACKKCGKEWI